MTPEDAALSGPLPVEGTGLRALRQAVIDAMPWYDESNPDYTELDAVLRAALSEPPVDGTRLREALVYGDRVYRHKHDFRPVCTSPGCLMTFTDVVDAALAATTQPETGTPPCHPACRFCAGAHDPRCTLADDHDDMCRDASGQALAHNFVTPDLFGFDRSATSCPDCHAVERWPDTACPHPWHHNFGQPFVRGERAAAQPTPDADR